jgi:hypothetical protein
MVEGHLLVLVLPPELPQVARHLPAYSTRQARSFLVAGRGQRVKQHASLYRSTEQSRFGTMALIRARGPADVTACCWLRGRHQQKFSATRQYWLLGKRSIRHSRPASQAGA